ncbi:MAG TPA: DUF4349 domain-containing protein [Candidatus Limnocylindrales bacterium]|nr:DUF4349 domain-containing protein [Candidatus Limnocylindrales bacterium]
MNRQSIPAWIPALSLIALLTLGCSGAASLPYDDQGNQRAPVAAQPASADRQDGAAVGEEAPSGSDTNSDGEQQVADGALIIHTGTLDLEVTELRPAVDQATSLIRGLGGNVAESHESNSDGRHTATVSYRIPAARWDEAVAALRAIGQRVVAEDIEAQDVTSQVIDLDARIANLRTTEAALQAIMVEAKTITDVLKVQSELTSVRSDIESMTAQRDHLADQAALGTLEVRFGGPVMATTAATQGWDLGHEVDAALAALVKLGQGVASLGVWALIVFLPVAIPIVGIFYLALWLRRRYAARHRVTTALSE